MTQLSPLDAMQFATPLNLSSDLGRKGELCWIDISQLVVDQSYQRIIANAGRRNIRRIAEGFRWELFGPLVVAPRGGGMFAILDGQHRANAARARGDISQVPCIVLDADYAMQAKAFATINGIVTKVSPQSIHRALAASGDPEATRLNEVCARAGVQILGYPQQHVRVGQTMSVGTLGQCLVRFGEAVLVHALSTITKTGDGNPGLLREGIISGSCDVLAEAPNWTPERTLPVVDRVGVVTLYRDALKAKADAAAGTMSIRKYYGDKLRSALASNLGEPGERQKSGVRTRKPGDATGRRFTGKPQHDPSTLNHLAQDHSAIRENRTLFPTTVISAMDSPRLLVSGANSLKLGKQVKKGEWAGFPIFQLTLEERASCPPTCNNRLTCYGNAMPFARRHKNDADLIPRLRRELAEHQRLTPRGFVVRLHVLGDFYDGDYVKAWAGFLREFPALHVFGYTAWGRESPIGAALLKLTNLAWDRFAIRFSADTSAPQGATTIWRKPEAAAVPEGIVCPAQTDATACCATCGMCWSANARDKTIVFIGHGGVGSGGRKPGTKTSGARQPAPKPKVAKARDEDIRRANEVHRLSQAMPAAVATKKSKQTPDELQAAIDAHLKEKGVRKFPTADSGDDYQLCEYLRRKGFDVVRNTAGGKQWKPFRVDEKQLTRDEFIALVNKHRAKDGLPTIGKAAA